MNRVAIHLSDPPPIDRDVICAVFRSVKGSGGRVVFLAQDVDDARSTLPDLVNRLGDDFDQLFTVVGDGMFEYIVRYDGLPDEVSVMASAQ